MQEFNDEDEFPVSDEYSLNSRIAYADLESKLPKHTKINEIRDYMSAIEYGQDWLILLPAKKGQIRGQEFRVQSKVIESNKKLSARRIGTKIKIRTINNLRQVPIPVMLHFIDKQLGHSYWMWLDEWFDANYPQNASGKKELPVYIPRKNLFDAEAVKRIQSYINLWHERAVIVKKATAASLHNRYYEYETTVNSHALSVAIYAKHKDAPPIDFSITPTAFDEEAFQRFNERGEPFKLRGFIKLNSKIPRFVMPDSQEMEILFFRVVDSVSFPASIEFLSSDGQSNYKIHYILFKLDTEGTKYRRFLGTALQEHLLCTLEVDLPNERVTFQLKRNPAQKSLYSYDTFFEFRKNVSNSTRFQITSLEPYGNASAQIPEDIFPPLLTEEILCHRLTKALLTIEESSKTKFAIPKTVNDNLVKFVETIAEIMTNGYTAKPMSEVNGYGNDRVLIVTTDAESAFKMKQDLEALDAITCWYRFDEPTTAIVLKHKINLGLGAYVYAVKRILNFDNFPPEITEENKNNLIQFPAEVDWGATLTAYKDWLPDDDQLGIDWLKQWVSERD